MLLCFQTIFLFGQDQISVKRTLQWNDTSYLFSAEDNASYAAVYFQGASYQKEGKSFLPVWGESFQLNVKGSADIKFINPVYEKIAKQELIGGDKISSDIQPSYYFTHSRGKNYIDISFIPIRKNTFTGNYEKLVSFDLEIRITPTPFSSLRSADAHVYAAESHLAEGTWYKIGATKKGVYKIDKSFLEKLGINLSSINTSQIGIFGINAGMLPESNDLANPDDLYEFSIYKSGLDDGSFDDGDYLLFYAEESSTWDFDPLTKNFTHQKNIYSDIQYYFLTTDMGTGKTISSQPNSASASFISTEKKDALFVWDNEKTNLVNSGRRWFDTQMDAYTDALVYSTTLPDLDLATQMRCTISFAAKSSSTTPSITVNGSGLSHTEFFGITPVSTENNYADVSSVTQTFLPTSSNISLSADFNGPSSAFGWMDFIELQGKSFLNYHSGSQLLFSFGDGVGTGNFTRYQINAPADIIIWDITNPINVYSQAFLFSADKCEFTLASDTLKNFIAFYPSDAFPSSELIDGGKVENQNLHSITSTPDYIIVTHPDFLSSARTFAAWHHDRDGYDTLVVTIGQLYNEFSGGTPDLTSIRNFMRMLYERAAGDESMMPKYLLLFGDASFDYKNIMYAEEENTNFVPTYESVESINQVNTYPTDDYVACLDYGEGADMDDLLNKLDIGVGRFPVKTTSEAEDVITKIMHYKSPETYGNWRNTYCFIADDEDGNTHIDDANDVADFISTNYPVYNLNKIYLDAYQQVPGAGGERYPDVNTALSNQIFSGALIINWAGHGNEQNWAQERILSVSDINSWTNYDKLPLFITATCSFSRFDNPDRTSGGELILLNAQGGGVSLLSTVRIVYSYANYLLNYNFNSHAFEKPDGKYQALGTALMKGKNDVVSTGDASNTRKFFLFGDPGLILNFPEYKVETTEVNGIPISTADTIKALEKVTIKGRVTNESGELLSDFNGLVYPTVYDKPIFITTLENDPGSNAYTFKLQKNAIYKGKATVANGLFEYSFIVPKDISYTYGFGKLSYYANNDATDANGYEENILIGGTADSITADNSGPQLDVYMNDESFVFGGLTDENPLLYIMLEDLSGMNTVGTGIGHDITATLDEDQQGSVKLNEYYEAALDDYTKGTVSYPLRDIEPGRHTVSVKAWDVYNNSGEGYTEFVVAESADLALDHVLNYPNPFTTNTSFWFEHNRPGDILDVKVEIFTVSGKLIKTIQEQVSTDGYRVSDIAWDGLDMYGDAIARGVYVYKLTVIAESDRSKANEFEKLVILR